MRAFTLLVSFFFFQGCFFWLVGRRLTKHDLKLSYFCRTVDCRGNKKKLTNDRASLSRKKEGEFSLTRLHLQLFCFPQGVFFSCSFFSSTDWLRLMERDTVCYSFFFFFNFDVTVVVVEGIVCNDTKKRGKKHDFFFWILVALLSLNRTALFLFCFPQRSKGKQKKREKSDGEKKKKKPVCALKRRAFRSVDIYFSKLYCFYVLHHVFIVLSLLCVLQTFFFFF